MLPLFLVINLATTGLDLTGATPQGAAFNTMARKYPGATFQLTNGAVLEIGDASLRLVAQELQCDTTSRVVTEKGSAVVAQIVIQDGAVQGCELDATNASGWEIDNSASASSETLDGLWVHGATNAVLFQGAVKASLTNSRFTACKGYCVLADGTGMVTATGNSFDRTGENPQVAAFQLLGTAANPLKFSLQSNSFREPVNPTAVYNTIGTQYATGTISHTIGYDGALGYSAGAPGSNNITVTDFNWTGGTIYCEEAPGAGIPGASNITFNGGTCNAVGSDGVNRLQYGFSSGGAGSNILVENQIFLQTGFRVASGKSGVTFSGDKFVCLQSPCGVLRGAPGVPGPTNTVFRNLTLRGGGLLLSNTSNVSGTLNITGAPSPAVQLTANGWVTVDNISLTITGSGDGLPYCGRTVTAGGALGGNILVLMNGLSICQ